MQISDTRILLQDAKRLLGEIETIHDQNVNSESIPPSLKLKIKQFLENIDSALGYEAINIFSKYCTVPESKLELHESKLYFPVKDNKEAYHKYIDKWYPGLRENKPEIITTIGNYQFFHSNSLWLSRLKYLVNKNKHRNLTKQSKKQRGRIDYMEDNMGNKFINCTFENVGTAVMVNGKPLDPTKSNPYLRSFVGNIENYFVFSDIDQPVMNTLYEIYSGAENLISELENII